jgi:cytoskeletal protein CcmA (bactofilin family)
VVGEGAVVRANIKAKTVILNGTIYGNVEAADRLEIHTNGRLYGNIKTAKLKIADGVVFEGNCEMIKPYDKSGKKEAPPRAEAKAETAG